MEELRESTRAYLDGRKFEHKVLPHPYAFNAFSHNTKIDPATAHNEEETKVINETRKIFGDPDIAIGITCVRIPVLRAHCVSVTFECEKPITPEEVREIMSKAPGVRVVDDQPRIAAFRAFQQRGQRRDVPFHAEDGIGDDEPAARRHAVHRTVERRDVARDRTHQAEDEGDERDEYEDAEQRQKSELADPATLGRATASSERHEVRDSSPGVTPRTR